MSETESVLTGDPVKDVAIRNRVLKNLLDHRNRVSLKMRIIADDLMMRGRRHDNSYSSDIEMGLGIKALSDNKVEAERSKKILEGIHETMNDYCPKYFKKGMQEMTLIQIIEFICDRMARCDEASITDDGIIPDLTADDYFEFMKGDLSGIPYEMVGIFKNTISCIMDNNKYIRGMMEKKEMELSEYVKVKEK